MYLAWKEQNKKRHYFIRQSVLSQGVYVSRDLMDLGRDPCVFLEYPGGRSFYIHEQVEEQLNASGAAWDYGDLEDVFWPFVSPDIKRSLQGFKSRDVRNRKIPELTHQEDEFIRNRLHIVDKRRYNYLRLGELDQSKLTRIPTRFYRPLAFKSRDELEHLFMNMEGALNPSEYSLYVYSFFYLRRFFDEIIAGKMPQGLDQDRLDRLFLQEICSLDRDVSFWKGFGKKKGLHKYLRRYVIMYFDYPFSTGNILQEHIRDFMARNRAGFQQPRPGKKEPDLKEVSTILGMSVQKLKKMSMRELTRIYRRRALKMHPDKGGDHEEFIRLNEAYQTLLKKIRPGT